MGSPFVQPGDILLAAFPYGDVPGMKLRPVLVLSDPIGAGPEILVAYISSVLPAVAGPYDITIDPLQPQHAGVGLRITSVLRLHKVATIHVSCVMRYLGTVDSATLDDVKAKLRQFLQL